MHTIPIYSLPSFFTVLGKLKALLDVVMVRKERCRSFDLAGIGEKKFVIKFIKNVESLSEDQAKALRDASSILGAEPIVISERGKEALQKGVVYYRHNVPVMNLKTFLMYLEGEFLKLATRGGIKVPIKDLRSFREKAGLSKSELAKKLGVSVEMVRKYEEGSAPSPEIAEKLKEIFGDEILAKPDFKVEEKERAVIMKAPFEIGIKKSRTLLISLKWSEIREENLTNIAELFGAEPVFIEKDELEIKKF